MGCSVDGGIEWSRVEWSRETCANMHREVGTDLAVHSRFPPEAPRSPEGMPFQHMYPGAQRECETLEKTQLFGGPAETTTV